MAAQFAGEAPLRRVHEAQNDDKMPLVEATLSPLEAGLKVARQKIGKLVEDNMALDRLTKSQEAALLDAQKTDQAAVAKAAMVDDLQNKIQELTKQIEICQEENKILEKRHGQKFAEVEKPTQTVRELGEAVLAGGSAASDSESARAKVAANGVAAVVANEGKDGNDKVMPVKQWLEERRFLQGEMQHLRDKLATAERATKSEAQLKEKFQQRLKVLEERLREPLSSSSSSNSSGISISSGPSHRQSLGGGDDGHKHTSSISLSKRNAGLAPQFKRSLASNFNSKKQARGISFKPLEGSRSFDRGNPLLSGPGNCSFKKNSDETKEVETSDTGKENSDTQPPSEDAASAIEDIVPGVFYDLLQKEFIAMKKAYQEKDQSLKDKDDAIEKLAKKVETLTKAMEGSSQNR